MSHNRKSAGCAGSAPPAIALFEPEIAANAAAVMRLAACLGLPLHLVEPTGFILDRRRLRRVGLDYLDRVALNRYPSWPAFEAWRRAVGRRLILLTTAGDVRHLDLRYRAGDVLLAGRETSGVPALVHAAADHRVSVPLTEGTRSLNVVTAMAIVAGEALRQLDAFPPAAKALWAARRPL
jgi:tRNA (cytidine/uridine-2'-O-)-methyltransferase